MGYEKDVSQIISAIESQQSDIHRQTVLLSATLTDGRFLKRFEPPRGKTNNVVSEQVGHKPGCTITEDN